MAKAILLSGVMCGVTMRVIPAVISDSVLLLEAPEAGESVPEEAPDPLPLEPVEPAEPVELVEPPEPPDAMVTLPAVLTKNLKPLRMVAGWLFMVTIDGRERIVRS